MPEHRRRSQRGSSRAQVLHAQLIYAVFKTAEQLVVIIVEGPIKLTAVAARVVTQEIELVAVGRETLLFALRRYPFAARDWAVLQHDLRQALVHERVGEIFIRPQHVLVRVIHRQVQEQVLKHHELLDAVDQNL